MNKVIDFHHHVTPPEYVKLMGRYGVSGNTAVKFKKFNPRIDQMIMRKAGIDKSYLSISTPGVYIKNNEISASAARIVNEFIRKMTDDYPDTYGGFGALPYPAVDESLKELEYIFDSLNLSGVVMLSNVGGTYFGEPGYDELFQELDRRKAVVFIHPDDLLMNEERLLSVTPYFERLLDTTRVGYNLLLNGYLEKYRNIRFILSHGGGGLPVMAGAAVREYFRIRNLKPDNAQFEEKMNLLKTFYFDTAQRGNEIINTLREFCGSSHIVFGSDYPYVPPFEIRMGLKEILAHRELTATEKLSLCAGETVLQTV